MAFTSWFAAFEVDPEIQAVGLTEVDDGVVGTDGQAATF
jgi:hypothetical protein